MLYVMYRVFFLAGPSPRVRAETREEERQRGVKEPARDAVRGEVCCCETCAARGHVCR